MVYEKVYFIVNKYIFKINFSKQFNKCIIFIKINRITNLKMNQK